MFHFTYTGVPQAVKYALKNMFQAHGARFSGVPRAPFAAIGVGLTELCFFTPVRRQQFPKFAKDRISRHKTRPFTLQKAANCRLKGGLLQHVP